MAAFLLDLFLRLDVANAVSDGRFDFPLAQPQLGELLDLDGLRSLAPNLPPRCAGPLA